MWYRPSAIIYYTWKVWCKYVTMFNCIHNCCKATKVKCCFSKLKHGPSKAKKLIIDRSLRFIPHRLNKKILKCYHHYSMMHVQHKQTSFQNVAHWGILNPCEPCESRHSQILMINSQWDGNEQLMRLSHLTLFYFCYDQINLTI